MKIEVLSVDQKENLVEKSQIEIQPGDRLLIKVTEIKPFDTIKYFHNKMVQDLENNVKVLTIPWFIELSVLKIS